MNGLVRRGFTFIFVTESRQMPCGVVRFIIHVAEASGLGLKTRRRLVGFVAVHVSTPRRGNLLEIPGLSQGLGLRGIISTVRRIPKYTCETTWHGMVNSEFDSTKTS